MSEARTLRIKTLGNVAVERDGEPVASFASSKAEALLVYLACTGRQHPRETLAELLWDDRSQRQALGNLRVVLSSLRKEVGDYVSITRSNAGINPAAVIWLDAVRLADAVAAVQEQGAIHTADDAQTLAEVLALYEGDFLAGFFLPQASGFESWAAAERERLHRLALDGMQRLARWHLEQGDVTQAIRWATRAVDIDPLAETSHRQLMEALARNGQRAQALAQYETCRQLLADELGLEPQEETRLLMEAIRADAYPHPARGGAETERRLIPHNLPAQLTPFFGRRRELAELEALLDDPHVRLITITGVGGTGKTRLAYAAAESLRARQKRPFGDGVFAISLSPVDSIEQLPAAIACPIDVSLEGVARDDRAGWRRLGAYLHKKQMLLVLDNFEHLLPEVEPLSSLLQHTTALKLLVTSRERLNLREEHVFPLAGLETTGDWSTVQDACDDPLGQLFLHSARRVRPDFEFGPQDLPQLLRLRQITGGLPLALEIASSWVELMPLGEIVAEIERDLDFLHTDLHNVPSRQRSMRTVFEASWRRLELPLQDAFCRLSVFRGGFTRHAAQEVADASLRQLAALSAKSLVQYDARQDRYQMHELLRQFGEQILQSQPQVDQVARHRHAAFYCRFLHEREQAWFGAEVDEALVEMDRELGNARTAWRWAVDQGDLVLMALGLESLCAYFDRRGYDDQAQEALQAARKALLPGSKQTEEEDIRRARLLSRTLAWFTRFAPSVAEGLAMLDEGAVVLQKLAQLGADARPEEALLALRRAYVTVLFDPLAALGPLDRARSLYQELEDVAGSAEATALLGQIQWHLGNYEHAATLLRQGLKSYRAIDYHRGVAQSLERLGLIEKHAGRLQEAEQVHREAYALLQEMDDRWMAAEVAVTLVNTLAWAGKFSEARHTALETLQLAEQMASGSNIAYAANALAFACLHLGRYDEARRYTEHSLSQASALGHRQTLGWAVMFLGQLNLAAASYAEATARLEEASAILDDFRKSIWMLPLALLSLAHIKSGRPALARQTLARALRENMEARVFFVVVNALPAAALLAADDGDLSGAIELHALACRYPYMANSRWFKDIMTPDVDKWQKALPPEDVAAAQARGRARDLWQTTEEIIEAFGRIEEQPVDG